VELTSARNTNEALRRQVRRLKSPGRTYLPGVAIGLVLGAVGGFFLRRLKRGGAQQQGQGQEQQQEGQEQQQGSSSLQE